jgi:GNAT superfamily N-acetyltransferase
VRDEREMRLAELFLEPAFHGRGWGTALVQEVIAEASQRGLPLRLRVLRSNPARRLYARLGFEVEQSSPERLWMVVQPRGRPPY